MSIIYGEPVEISEILRRGRRRKVSERVKSPYEELIERLEEKFRREFDLSKWTFKELATLFEYYLDKCDYEDAKDVASMIDEKSGFTHIRDDIDIAITHLSDAWGEAQRLAKEEEEEKSGII